jgi:hypothetical protein
MGAPVNVIYVSYDGALDPLGASQVVPYLLGLADRGVSLTLISFEKPARWRQASVRAETQQRLASHSIRWKPLRYHKRPRLPATLLDVVVGGRAIASEVRRSSAALVHCRGDVAMMMARLADRHRGTRLLYDVRGFFSDERVQAGSWRPGSFVDRLVRRAEAQNLQHADGIVTLTQLAARELLCKRPSLRVNRVIPTCVDIASFSPRDMGQNPRYGLVFSGSLGTWYMATEMVTFARSVSEFIPGRALFLTPQTDEGHRLGVTPDWAEICAVDPRAVASWLRRARALFFLGQPAPARCPTKFAEGLASGLPVVCNRGIGDLDEIVERERVGVLVDSLSPDGYRDAGRRLRSLLDDPELSVRCRRLAESRYSLERGVESYHQLYRDVTTAPADRRSCGTTVE